MKRLLPHQTYAIECMEVAPRLGIFFHAGTGKTAIVLSWLIQAMRDGRVKKALIAVPASLVPSWEQERDGMIEFEGVTQEDIDALKENVLIRSYQKLYRTNHTTVRHRDGIVTEKKGYALREDVDIPFDAVIYDESQAISSHKSVNYKVSQIFAKACKYAYILTGTPISGSTKAGGEDLAKLFGQFKFLNPGIWRNWTDFCERYVTSYNKYFQPTGYRSDELHKLMAEMAIMTRLEDCVDLPEAVFVKVPCPLVEKATYKDFDKYEFGKYGIEIRTAGVKFQKMLQLCSGSVKTEDGKLTFKTSKDNVLSDILDESDEKLVIFCSYTASIDRCHKICKKKGIESVIFDGRSNGPTWKKFTEGDAQVLIVQYAAGGAGLNLQTARRMVLYEPCFSSLHWTQALARIMRTGQTRSCIYKILVTPKTVEERVLESVMNGVSVTAQTFEEWARTGTPSSDKR